MREGWEMKKLGEVCEILDSKRKPITERDRIKGKYPYYGATGILDYVHEYIFDERLILIGEDGAKWKSGDKTAFIAEGKYWVNNHAHVIRVNKKITNDKWVVYYLNFSDLSTYITGLTVQKLNQEKMRGIEIPIPSLLEQQHIVSILDKTFAAIDEAKTNTEKNLNNAKELFQSQLNKIFLEKGEDWMEKKLGEVTTKIGSGATPRGGQESYKESGISLIRSMNVYDDGFKEKNLAFIDDEQAKDLNNVRLEENDILLNITGASVARCCIVPKEILPARVNQHVSIIRPIVGIVESKFLHYLLISRKCKEKLLGIGEQGSTRQAITKAQIENFRVAFPRDLKKQIVIVSQLDLLSTETKKLEALYQQKLVELEDLKKSILEKAFKGELSEKEVAV